MSLRAYIHKLEFEKKPEIMETLDSNYQIARQVYQQLTLDISELFADFIKSLRSSEMEDMNNDICNDGWVIKKSY